MANKHCFAELCHQSAKLFSEVGGSCYAALAGLELPNSSEPPPGPQSSWPYKNRLCVTQGDGELSSRKLKLTDMLRCAWLGLT